MIIGNGIADTGGESETLNGCNNSPKVIYEYLFGVMNNSKRAALKAAQFITIKPKKVLIKHQ